MTGSSNYVVDRLRSMRVHCARESYRHSLDKQTMHSLGDNSFHDRQLEAQTKLNEMLYLESVMRNACK